MMNSQDLNRLMNDLRIKLQGASDAGIKSELFNVLQEFIDESNCWTEGLTVNILPATQTYTLTPAKGGLVLRLVNVIDVNQINYPATLTDFNPPSATMLLTYPQNQPFPVTVTVIKNVVLPLSAHEFPDAPSWLLPRFYQYVLDGCLGKMKAQSNKTFSDPTGAAYHLKRFEVGKSMAKVATMRAALFGGQSWRFPRGYAWTSQRGGVSTPFPSDQGFGV